FWDTSSSPDHHVIQFLCSSSALSSSTTVPVSQPIPPPPVPNFANASAQEDHAFNAAFLQPGRPRGRGKRGMPFQRRLQVHKSGQRFGRAIATTLGADCNLHQKNNHTSGGKTRENAYSDHRERLSGRFSGLPEIRNKWKRAIAWTPGLSAV